MKNNTKYFDLIAQNFESYMNPFDLATRIEWFAVQLDHYKVKGKLVLDVGCGLGHFSNLVSQRNGYPVVLDIARRLLIKVKPELPNCIQGNALQLPFKDGTFSFLISSECIEHTIDPQSAIREMVRVLKPGGIIIISTPNYTWRWSIYIAEIFKIRKFAGIENWLTRSEVKKSLTESGTEIIVNQGLYIMPFQLKPLWPLIAWVNYQGQVLQRWMINQCWVAKKL